MHHSSWMSCDIYGLFTFQLEALCFSSTTLLQRLQPPLHVSGLPGSSNPVEKSAEKHDCLKTHNGSQKVHFSAALFGLPTSLDFRWGCDLFTRRLCIDWNRIWRLPE